MITACIDRGTAFGFRALTGNNRALLGHGSWPVCKYVMETDMTIW